MTDLDLLTAYCAVCRGKMEWFEYDQTYSLSMTIPVVSSLDTIVYKTSFALDKNSCIAEVIDFLTSGLDFPNGWQTVVPCVSSKDELELRLAALGAIA